MALTFGGPNNPMPAPYSIWRMAEQFGWTLDYIDSLPLARWHEHIQIEDGRAHHRNSLFNKSRGRRQ
jgi:hypothetical protein